MFDLFAALKPRIVDPNKSLVRGFVGFTARLIEACGKDIKPHSKTLI